MDHIRLPSYRAQPEVPTRSDPHVYIPKEKMNEILSRFPEGATAFIPLQFGYRCGMRLGEAFAIEWDDVDIEAKKITIRRQIQWDAAKKSWYFTDPKYNSVRQIDIDQELARILDSEHKKQDASKLYYGENYIELFEDSKRYINTDKKGRAVHLVTVRANGELISPRIMQHTSSIVHYQLKFPEFDFHSLRHTHATMLAEADAPMKYVQARLGHKNIQVTLQIYQHLTQTISEHGAEKLGEIFTAE